MSSMPDLTENDAFDESAPTIEMDVSTPPNAEALRELVDQFSEKFNDDIREDLDSTAIQETPSLDQFRSLDDWTAKLAPGSHRREAAPPSCERATLHDAQFDHYAEIMAIVRSYEKMLDEKLDLGISLKNYPEMGTFRLLSISVYRSGSVTILGTDKEHMPINVYDKIDNISFAIVPLRREKREKPRNKISFFFHERPTP